jgi:hypothetical protein
MMYIPVMPTLYMKIAVLLAAHAFSAVILPLRARNASCAFAHLVDVTTAKSVEPTNDDVCDMSVDKTLDLIAMTTSAMKRNAMRMEAADAAHDSADCIHPAYEVL